MNAGELLAGLQLELAGFRAGLNEARRHTRAFASDFQNSFERSNQSIQQVQNSLNRTGNSLRDFERIVGGIMFSQAFYGMKSAIEDAAGALFTFMNDMEKAQIALEYFLATPKEAESFLVQMNDFAAETAFNTAQALSLSRRLMAAQFNPNDVKHVMTVLNDAAAASGGTAEQMDRIVLALSQIKTNGKLAGQEMRQLGEAGIPIYKIIQEELGLTGEQVLEAGKLGISGEKAVAAILNGLEKRYKGAAERIANTIPGMMDTIRDDLKILGTEIFQEPFQALGGGIRVIRDFLEDARDAMNEGGLGKMMEEMFPPSLHASIRAIVGSMKTLGQSFVAFMKAVQPIFEILGGGFVMALGALLPVVAGVARAVAWLAQAAMDTVPPLKYLLAAIVALLVAQTVAKVMVIFWNVLRLGAIASAVAKSVMTLVAALKALTFAMTRNPVIALVVVLAAALLHLTGASKYASKWLENLMDKLAALGGFDINKVLQPKDTDLIDVGEFESDLEKIEDSFGETTDDMEDKAKKFKKFLASFDEVFQVPEPEKDEDNPFELKPPDFDLNVPDLETEITDKLPREIELPKFKWPELPWWAIRPINIRWNIEPIKWPKPPNFPGPPPAVVTLWETFLEGIKVRMRGLQVIFEGWRIPAPVFEPIPVPNLQPVLNPVLQWLKEWAGEFGHAWEGVWDPIRQPVNLPIPNLGPALEGVLKELEEWGKQLQEKWGGLWQPSPKPILNVIPALEAAWGQFKGVFSGGLGLVAVGVSEGLSALGSAISGWASTAWESLGQMGTNMVAGWNSSMQQMGEAWTTFSEWFVSGWDTAIDAMGNFFSGAGELIMSGISAAWEGIKNGFSSLGTWLADHWKQVLAGVAIAIIGAIAIFFAPISAAVAGAAGAVTTGVTTVIAGIGAALAILAAVWDDGREAVIQWGKDVGKAIGDWASATWDTITEWSSETWNTISTWTKDTAKDVGDWAKGVGKSIGDWATETGQKVSDWGGNVKDWFTDVWNTGSEKATSLATTVKDKFTDWTTEAGTKVTTFRDNFGTWMGELPGKMTTGIQNIPNLFTGIMDKLPAPVKTALDKGLAFFKSLPNNIKTAITSIPQKFSGVFGDVTKSIPKIISQIVKPFTGLPDAIWKAIKSIPDKIASVFKNIKLPSFSGMADGVKTTWKNITGFATGGIINKDSIVRVGEGGRREAIIPMENGNAMAPFADAVAERLRGQQPTPGTPTEGDDRQILYVGTLIADERGLKELERKMRIIRDGEDRRGGGRG